MSSVIIYTDGACSGNPGIGGWGALLKFPEYEKEIFGGEVETTNNRMELTAAIEALSYLGNESYCVDIYTDSQYLRLGITEWIKSWLKNGWRNSQKQEVKNKELWIKLLDLTHKHEINWHWIKGHANHEENERADALARTACLNVKLKN